MQRVKDDFNTVLKEDSITVLDITVKAWRYMRTNNIITVKDLMAFKLNKDLMPKSIFIELQEFQTKLEALFN